MELLALSLYINKNSSKFRKYIGRKAVAMATLCSSTNQLTTILVPLKTQVMFFKIFNNTDSHLR